VIKSIPTLKDECGSFPTLRELLQNETSSSDEITKLRQFVHEYKDSLDFYEKLVDLNSFDINAIKKVVESYLNMNEIDNAIGILSLLQCTEQTKAFQSKFYLKVYLEGAEHSLRKSDHEEARMRFSQAYYAVCSQKKCDCAFECECCDFLVLCFKHATHTQDCKVSQQLSHALVSCLDVKVLVNNKDCLPRHKDCLSGDKMYEYLETAMEKAKHILPILTEDRPSETSESAKYLMDIIRGQHYKKSLAFSVGNVNCNFEHAINIPGSSCNESPLPGTDEHLVSEVIKKISKL
jgi:hypothetical protein